jgi:hypothetical protein
MSRGPTTRTAWLPVVVLAQAACTDPSAAPTTALVAKPPEQTSAGSGTSVIPATAAPPNAAAPPTSITGQPLAALPPEYASRGRRDPFEPVPPPGPETAGPTARRRSVIASAKLAGIVHGVDGPLALVEMPNGIGYVLKPGDAIEDGRLIQIRPDSALFDIPPKAGLLSERIVLTLGQS